MSNRATNNWTKDYKKQKVSLRTDKGKNDGNWTDLLTNSACCTDLVVCSTAERCLSFPLICQTNKTHSLGRGLLRSHTLSKRCNCRFSRLPDGQPSRSTSLAFHTPTGYKRESCRNTAGDRLQRLNRRHWFTTLLSREVSACLSQCLFH